MKYAIYGTDESEIQEEPMYWSNEFGWVALSQADFFTKEETEKLNLPVGGQWIMTNDPLEPSWDNDLVQFARLLAELNATQDPSEEDFQCLKESMDLETDEICELYDRAIAVFEDSKTRIPIGG